RRITNPTANSTTITGLVGGGTYAIEVVSFSKVGETFPAVEGKPTTDITPPTVTASLGTGTYPIAQQVTLTANEPGSQIFYTTDGSDPVTDPQQSATHYTGPITISASTTLKFVAFDPSSNVSEVVTAEYDIPSVGPLPLATTITATAAQGAVTLVWAPANPGVAGLTITAYKVDVFDSATATSPIRTETTNGDVTTL